MNSAQRVNVVQIAEYAIESELMSLSEVELVKLAIEVSDVCLERVKLAVGQ